MAKIGTFDQNFVGLEIYPKGSSVNVRSSSGTQYPIIITKKAGELVGLTTGAYNLMNDGKWIQTKIGEKYAYVRSDVVNIVPRQQVSKDDAFGMIKKLVDSDKLVYESLVKNLPVLSALKNKGIDTAKFDQVNKDLWTRLYARQDFIKKSNMVKWESGIKKAFEDVLKHNNPPIVVYGQPYSLSGIGELPVIIVGIIAGIGLTVGAYFMFKPKYDESTADLKISKDLETLLAKTDPATAKRITDDLEKQIDTAYNQGKTDGTFGGITKILLPVGLLLGGYLLVSSFIRHETRKNS